MSDGKRRKYHAKPEKVKFKILTPENFFANFKSDESVRCISCLKSEFLFDNIPGHKAVWESNQSDGECPRRLYNCCSSSGTINYYYERELPAFFITVKNGQTYIKPCICALSRDENEIDEEDDE